MIRSIAVHRSRAIPDASLWMCIESVKNKLSVKAGDDIELFRSMMFTKVVRG